MGKVAAQKHAQPMGHYANVTRDNGPERRPPGLKVRRPARRTVEGGAPCHRRHGRGTAPDAGLGVLEGARCWPAPNDHERAEAQRLLAKALPVHAASTNNWRWKNWASARDAAPAPRHR